MRPLQRPLEPCEEWKREAGAYSSNGKEDVSIPPPASRFLPFSTLAKRRRFDQIRKLLIDLNVNHGTWLTLGIQKRGTTALHVILEHRPPLDVTVLLIEKLSSKPYFVVPEQARDNTGQTPLHVAVSNECDFSVINRLLRGLTGSFPARIQDNQGCLPLHVACSHKRLDGKTGEAAKIIKLLLAHYPESATVIDHRGRTPLDYAKQMIQTHQWNVKEFARAGSSCKVTVDRGGKNTLPVLRVTEPLPVLANGPTAEKTGKRRADDNNYCCQEEKKEEHDPTPLSKESVPGQLICKDFDSDTASVVSDLTNPPETIII
mgnify:CR=1 FL=1